MFTLKLHQNGAPTSGRVIIMEVAGIWADQCGHGVRHLIAFKKTVGVEDEEGSFRCYVGGDHAAFNTEANQPQPQGAPVPVTLDSGPGGNYCDWGVLETALGKTSEMLR